MSTTQHAEEATETIPQLGEKRPAPTRGPSLRRVLDRPWLVAAVLVLLFGLLIAVLTPPFTGADERDHFTRAFQISRGSVLTTKHDGVYGAYLPVRFAQEAQALSISSYVNPDHVAFLHLLGAPAPSGPTEFVSLANAASYGPGAYAAYVPALVVGRLLGLSTLALLYLARFAGVLAYASLLALAVRRLPVHRWILVAGGLVPAALNQASTVSADGLTMALTFVVVAEALHLSVVPTEKVRQSLVEVGLAVVLLALAKPPYILLAGLLLIPAWRQRGRIALALGGILGAGALLAIGWGSYQGAHSLSQDRPHLFLDTGVDKYAFRRIEIHHQTMLVLTRPWVFLAALGRSLDHAGLSTLQQLFGRLASYQEPWWIVLLALATFLVSIVVNEKGSVQGLDLTSRICLFAGVVVVSVSIYVIAYTNWNAYHAPLIEEVPTRYFLALLPMLLVAVLPAVVRVAPLERRLDPRWLLCVLLVVLLSASVVGLWHFHYTGPAPFALR